MLASAGVEVQSLARTDAVLVARQGGPADALRGRRAEDENRVEAAKSEAVRHGVTDLTALAGVRRVVQVALGIGLVEAGRGRHIVLLDGLDGRDRFDAAAG